MKNSVGVIVSRFQIDELSLGHKHLIDYVSKRHDKMLIALGVSPRINSKRDPMDFLTRKMMVEDFFIKEHIRVKLEVLSIEDKSSNHVWSESLDALIEQHFPRHKVVLYGGRDSFLRHYRGKLEGKTIRDKKEFTNATLRRVFISKHPEATPNFRRGVIYAAEKQYPHLYMCADIAVVKQIDEHGKTLETPQVLLGRKHAGDHLRFPGGFVDPSDECLEAAAFREMQEEAGTGIVPAGGEGYTAMEYIASMIIDDWRYPATGKDRIMTSFFYLPYGWGPPKAGDDLVEINWYDLNSKTKSQLGPFHQNLFDTLSSYLAQREERLHEKVGS